MHGQQNKIQDFCFGNLTGGQAFSSRTYLIRFILDIADETNSADGGEIQIMVFWDVTPSSAVDTCI